MNESVSPMHIQEGSPVSPPQGEELVSLLYHPRCNLIIFMAINLFTYFDRGALNASIRALKTNSQLAPDGPLSNAKTGALVSIFMVGFMVTCPIFAVLEKWIRPTRIVCLGLFMWVLSTFCCAISFNYFTLAIARAFVGIGEAAYAGYVGAMIDNIAPEKSRTLWFGLYFAMCPVGQAAGVAVGGVLSTLELIRWDGWRVTFLSGRHHNGTHDCALLRFSLQMPLKPKSESYQFGYSNSLEPTPSTKSSSNKRRVGCARCWVTRCIMFALGGISVWGITFMVEGPLKMSNNKASLMLGAFFIVNARGRF